MKSPIASLVGALTQKMSGSSEFSTFFNDEHRRTMLRAIFDSYYADVPAGDVVFDTNRTWTGKLALLELR